MNIFQMSILGSLIIFVVVLLRVFIKDRLPKKMLWALWCIALLRLVFPVYIYHEWSVFSMIEKMGYSLPFEIREEYTYEKNSNSLNSDAIVNQKVKNSNTSDSKGFDLKYNNFNVLNLNKLGSKAFHFEARDLNESDSDKFTSNEADSNAFGLNALNLKNGDSNTLKQFDIVSLYVQNKNIFLGVWLVGALACFGVFIHLYLKNVREFENSKEIEGLEELKSLKETGSLREIESLTEIEVLKAAETLKEAESLEEVEGLEEIGNLKNLEKWRFLEDIKATLKRKISFRVSKKICSPLTYGIVNPTVLLPEDIFEYDDADFRYVLYHEYVHIRRFDSLSKVVLALVLCIHWFNPFVWLMYVLANRDIELICDECVIEHFGNEKKANYAKALISVEERKLCFSPVSILCSNFIKEDIEERIVSIMKKKKSNWMMKGTSLVIIIAVVVLFVTSRPSAGVKTGDVNSRNANTKDANLSVANENNTSASNTNANKAAEYVEYEGKKYKASDLSEETLKWLEFYNALSDSQKLAINHVPAEFRGKNANTDDVDASVSDTANEMFFDLEKEFSKEEIKRLQSFKYSGYQNLSVEAFQQKAWSDIDNQADMELLEKFSGVTFLKSHEYGDLVHYLETTFLPLTSEKWRERGIVINGYASYFRGDKVETKEFEQLMDAYSPVEYSIKLSILNNKKVLVREYEKIRKNVEGELIDYIFGEYERYEKVLSNASKQDFSKNLDIVKALDLEKMKSKFKELEKKYSDEFIKVEISDSIPEFTSDADENAKVNITQTGMSLDVQSDEEEESGLMVTEGFSEEFDEKELNSPKKSDIDALLRLQEPNYEKMSVSEFNKKVLDFSNADYDRTERLNAYVFNEDYLRAVYDISDEENRFITISYMLSGMENAASIRSAHTKQKQSDVEVASFDYVKQFNTKERNSWCNLSYRFHYHLKDSTQISVKERDESVVKMFELTSEFWKKNNLEMLLKFDKKSILKKLQEFAKECSTDKISISVNLEDVFFETLNEHIRQ